VISGLLLLEMLRRPKLAVASDHLRPLAWRPSPAVGVAASPVQFRISGYHGNTDPVFVMLVLQAIFPNIDRSMKLSGRVALGLTIEVKLIPIVVVPTVAVYLVNTTANY